MKQMMLIGIVLVLGVILGSYISPLVAQSHATNPQQETCFVGEASNAACSGKWIFFSGNTGNLDESVWLVRVNGETGAIWYKDGKKLQLLQDAE